MQKTDAKALRHMTDAQVQEWYEEDGPPHGLTPRIATIGSMPDWPEVPEWTVVVDANSVELHHRDYSTPWCWRAWNAIEALKWGARIARLLDYVVRAPNG